MIRGKERLEEELFSKFGYIPHPQEAYEVTSRCSECVNDLGGDKCRVNRPKREQLCAWFSRESQFEGSRHKDIAK